MLIPFGVLSAAAFAPRPVPPVIARNGVAGYVGGGNTDANGEVCVATVDKFAFSNDARSTLGTGLSSSRRLLAGFANPNVAGYFAGGLLSNFSSVATVDKFAFSNDGRSTLELDFQPQLFLLQVCPILMLRVMLLVGLNY